MFQLMISVGLPISLILIMTGVGLSLTGSDFVRVFQQPKGFLLGALMQMLFLPLAALVVIQLFGLEGELAIGLFILSLCPGGVTSNLYSYLAKADVGLSVSLTAIIGFITPFTIPLLAAWAISIFSQHNQSFSLPFLQTWLQLMIISVLPVLAGMAIRHKKPAFARSIEPVVRKLSVIILALVILAICINLGSKLVDFALAAGPASIFLNLLTMSAGYVVARKLLADEKQAKTICLEVGLQNGTLALFICGTLLNSPAMLVAPSIYSLVMFVSASLFVTLIKHPD